MMIIEITILIIVYLFIASIIRWRRPTHCWFDATDFTFVINDIEYYVGDCKVIIGNLEHR
jgi:hypothetical protein